jgi:hypothetical protein
MDQRCWFLKDGKRIEEGIECVCRFKSPGGLEIYDVTHNGQVIGEIYAGTPCRMIAGYSFELEDVT